MAKQRVSSPVVLVISTVPSEAEERLAVISKAMRRNMEVTIKRVSLFINLNYGQVAKKNQGEFSN